MKNLFNWSITTVILSSLFLINPISSISQTWIPPDFFNDPASTSLHYYENKGQLIHTNGDPTPDILYYMNRSVPELYMADSRVSFVWHNQDTATSFPDTLWRIDMMLVGETVQPTLPQSEGTGEDYLNFFLAHCPQGITNCNGYERLVYPGIYPGIDMHLYSSPEGPKFYFVIHPGADPMQLRLQFEGQDTDTVTNGHLILEMDGEALDLAPALAFNVNPSNNQITPLPWAAAFVDLWAGQVEFDLSTYNASEYLVLQMGAPPQARAGNNQDDWITYHGGSNESVGMAMKSDSKGRAYLTGYTLTTNFPLISGTAPQTQHMGGQEAFVMKFDEFGVPVWGTFFGGMEDEYAEDLAINNAEEPYIVGTTLSSNMPTVPLGNSQFGSATHSGFIFKLNDVGTQILWSRYIGEDNSTLARSVDINSMQEVYVAGYTSSIENFPLSPNNTAYFQNAQTVANADGFLLKFGVNYNLIW